MNVSILAIAFQYIGVPYKYGGYDTTGIDCSGFVKKVLEHFGIDAPRRARDYVNFGKPIPLNSIIPGDILLFKFEHKYVDHVGIYVGNDSVIHSASNRGVVVEGLEYIRKNLVGARRIFISKKKKNTSNTYDAAVGF